MNRFKIGFVLSVIAICVLGFFPAIKVAASDVNVTAIAVTGAGNTTTIATLQMAAAVLQLYKNVRLMVQ